EVWHSVPGLDITLAAILHTQRCAAIVDADLGEQRKDELIHPLPAQGDIGDVRENMSPEECKEPRGAYKEIKHPIGGFQQPLSDLDTFFAIGIQNPPVCTASQDQC